MKENENEMMKKCFLNITFTVEYLKQKKKLDENIIYWGSGIILLV